MHDDCDGTGAIGWPKRWWQRRRQRQREMSKWRVDCIAGGGTALEHGNVEIQRQHGECRWRMCVRGRGTGILWKYYYGNIPSTHTVQEQLIDAILAFSLVFIPTVLSVCIGAMGFASKFFLA